MSSSSSAAAPSEAALSDRSGLRAYYVSKLDELELVTRDKSQNLRRLAAQRSALNTKGACVARGRAPTIWSGTDVCARENHVSLRPRAGPGRRPRPQTGQAQASMQPGPVTGPCVRRTRTWRAGEPSPFTTNTHPFPPPLFFPLAVRNLREELLLLQEPGSYVGEVIKAMGKNKVLVKVGNEGKYIVDIDKDIDIAKCVAGARVALRSDSYQLHRILPTKVDPLVSLMKVEKVPDSTYDMVGGLDKQIQELKEVIELPIKHPELFEALGVAQPKVRRARAYAGAAEGWGMTRGLPRHAGGRAGPGERARARASLAARGTSPLTSISSPSPPPPSSPPQGVLMYGPPGTGKTLLARAVAHHTDCTFIRISGAELVQKYIGEGARMVRELFVMAREAAPSIIFMDEVDSIGEKKREREKGRGDVDDGGLLLPVPASVFPPHTAL